MCSPNKLDIKLIICNTIFLKMSKFTSSRTKLTCNFFMRRKLLHLRFELHIIFGEENLCFGQKIKVRPTLYPVDSRSGGGDTFFVP